MFNDIDNQGRLWNVTLINHLWLENNLCEINNLDKYSCLYLILEVQSENSPGVIHKNIAL